MRCFQQMPPHTKQIVNWAVYREKALGLPRRFEPPHLAFLLARGLMRDFGPVICSFVLAMRDPGHKLPARRSITAKLVSHVSARVLAT